MSTPAYVTQRRTDSLGMASCFVTASTAAGLRLVLGSCSASRRTVRARSSGSILFAMLDVVPTAALEREIWEETGLIIGIPTTTAVHLHIDSESYPSGLTIAFEVSDWRGKPSPHESDILAVEFVDIGEAVERLAKLPSREHHEPFVAYLALTGEVPSGTTWLIRQRACTSPPSRSRCR